jgi:hypothetical protein
LRQGLIEIGEFTNDRNQSRSSTMSFSADALYKMSEAELLAAYAEARRQFVEKKFARDTQRARLAWSCVIQAEAIVVSNR